MQTVHDILIDITDVANYDSVVSKASKLGIDGFFSKTKVVGINGLKVYTTGNEPGSVPYVVVRDKKDAERAIEASETDAPFVAVNCTDWKIIPLENLIAEFRRRGKKLYACVEDDKAGKLAFSILEKGVDGIILPPAALDKPELKDLLMSSDDKIVLEQAEVISVDDVGDGERVCIDTVSLLSPGEGMLVGSRSNFFFLVHGETIEGRFVPPRPFRVNAGAVHSYALTAIGETRYLSELEAGETVLVVDKNGRCREVAIGRCKIERRPLVMVKARVKRDEGTEVGNIILQKAETIRLVDETRKPVAVTELREGSKVTVHVSKARGRHVGKEVDEFIIER
ncbi:MAG: 3-dehydroquinate synthase II [Conexivisphaerales archaeon]